MTGNFVQSVQNGVLALGAFQVGPYRGPGVRIDDLSGHQIFLPDACDSATDQSTDVFAQANFTADDLVDGLGGRLVHALQSVRELCTRKDVGVRGLLEADSEGSNEGAVENGLAGLIIEIGDEDPIPWRERKNRTRSDKPKGHDANAVNDPK